MKKISFIFVIIIIALFPFHINADSNSYSPYLRCIPIGEDGKKVSEEEECPLYDTSILQLLTRPEIFDGKRVLISGYIHLEFEGRGIFLRKDDYDLNQMHHAIWVGDIRENARIDNCQDAYVSLKGKYNARDHGHFGMYGGSITDISHCVSRD